MSFQTELEKLTSKKIILFEYDRGTDLTTSFGKWAKEEPNIWKYPISNPLVGSTVTYNAGTGAAGYFAAGSSGTGTSPDNGEIIKTIRSMIVDIVRYVEADALSDLRLTDSSFYFDATSQILYVRFNEDQDPWDFDNISIGLPRGFSTEAGFYNGLFYADRIINLSNIKIQKDPLQFGLLTLGDFSVSLSNVDGEFSDIEDDDIFGQECRVYVGFDGLDYDEFKQVYTGYLQNIDYDDDNITIRVKDDRAILSRKIPINSFDQTSYSNLKEDFIGRPIAIGYGVVKRQTATCTNDEATAPANYSFKFVDTTYHNIQSIDTVYVDGVETATASSSTSNGTFSIASANYEPGQEVQVSYHGYVDDDGDLIDNTLDIISDIIDNFLDFSFVSLYYNTSEWNSSKTRLTEKISFSTDGGQLEVVDIISELCSSINGLFIVNAEGKFSFKLRDPDLPSVTTVRFWNVLSKVKRYAKDTEYLSSVKLGYNKSFGPGRHSYVYDRSKQTEIVSRYRKYKEREIKTIITDKTDAEAKALEYVNLFAGAVNYYDFTTNFEFMTLLLEDNITAQIITNDVSNDDYGYVKLEVVKVDLDLNNFRVNITGRYIQDKTTFTPTLLKFVKNDTINGIINFKKSLSGAKQMHILRGY